MGPREVGAKEPPVRRVTLRAMFPESAVHRVRPNSSEEAKSHCLKSKKSERGVMEVTLGPLAPPREMATRLPLLVSVAPLVRYRVLEIGRAHV